MLIVLLSPPDKPQVAAKVPRLVTRVEAEKHAKAWMVLDNMLLFPFGFLTAHYHMGALVVPVTEIETKML